MKRFLGFFTKHRKQTKLKRQIDDLSLTILSFGTITNISEAEVDNIVKIIREELKNVSNMTGHQIAKRIVKESVNPEICTATVYGEEDGTEWLIKLSNNQLEHFDL